MTATTFEKARWAGITVVGAFTIVSAGSALASKPAFLPLAIDTVRVPELVIPEIEPSPCPENMALVEVGGEKVCVDKYEGSLVEIESDGTEVEFSPHEAPNGHQVRAMSRPGVIPQGHISMVEAKRACAASNKRLCRAGEWKAACKGPASTRYPYGDERVPNACVDTDRTSPMNVLHGGEYTRRTLNDPRANQVANTVEETGAASACTNDYGVHDMVGNVHEWTDDGSFRGGYYLDTKLNGEGCNYRTTAHAPDYYDYSTGFRCCADPTVD